MNCFTRPSFFSLLLLVALTHKQERRARLHEAEAVNKKRRTVEPNVWRGQECSRGCVSVHNQKGHSFPPCFTALLLPVRQMTRTAVHARREKAVWLTVP